VPRPRCHPGRRHGKRGGRPRAVPGARHRPRRPRRAHRRARTRRPLPRRTPGGGGGRHAGRRHPPRGGRILISARMRAAHLTGRRLAATATTLVAILLVSLAAATLIGPVHASLRTALGDGGERTPDFAILFRTRLPRVLLGGVVGGALGCSGASLQALLGNPLADPHLLGVSAGAAVAGAIALVLGADPVSPLVPLAAFAGALGTVAAVFLVARASGRTSPYAVLLVGIVCNALGAAALMLVNAIASYTQAQGILFWIMGSLSA